MLTIKCGYYGIHIESVCPSNNLTKKQTPYYGVFRNLNGAGVEPCMKVNLIEGGNCRKVVFVLLREGFFENKKVIYTIK